MAMQGYSKLFNSILASTIWSEPDHVRIIWITMLAMADKDGVVSASVPGLAALARTSVEKCEESLLVLSGPDRYSRTKEFEGRRIEETDGGWKLLNYEKYKRKLSAEERREYLAAKQREYRERDKRLSTNVDNVSDTDTRLTHSDSDSDSDSDTRSQNLSPTKGVGGELGSPQFHKFWQAYPRKVDKQETLKSWVKGLCDGKHGEILAGLERWKTTGQWSDPEMVPYPSTWLNKRRWKDEPQKGTKLSAAESKARKTDEAAERVRQRLNSQASNEAQ